MYVHWTNTEVCTIFKSSHTVINAEIHNIITLLEPFCPILRLITRRVQFVAILSFYSVEYSMIFLLYWFYESSRKQVG